MKKIERVVIYGSLGLRPGLSDLLWAFRKRNKLEEFPVYLDDHPFQLYERIKREMKFGLRTADLVLVPHYMALQMSRDGLLSRCRPGELDAYSENLRDRNMTWFAVGVTFMSMAYNLKLLRPATLPESLEDLSSAKWRGRLGMQSLTASKAGNLGAHYIAYLKRRVGDKRWRNFLESLAGPSKPKTFDCIDHLLQGLIDGVNLIALTVYSLAYFREKTAGSSVALLRMRDAPPMLTFTSAGIIKNSGENPSALRFLDFILSEEAQRIVGSIPGISPSRPGISASYNFEQRYTERSEFHPDSYDLEEIPRAMETFRRMRLP